MAADGHQPSNTISKALPVGGFRPPSSVSRDLARSSMGSGFLSSGDVFNGGTAGSSFKDSRFNFIKEKPLVIKGGGLSIAKKVSPVLGKGKGVVLENDLIIPRVSDFLVPKKLEDGFNSDSSVSSSRGFKINDNRFGKLNPISALEDSEVCPVKMMADSKEPGPSIGVGGEGGLWAEAAATTNVKIMKDDMKTIHQCVSRELNLCQDRTISSSLPSLKEPAGNGLPNVWSKKPNIKVVNLDYEDCLTEYGKAVKLDVDKELENTRKLENAIVVKVFVDNVPFSARFGKFHLTLLGLQWILCSFNDPEAIESLYSEGPWYVNGHIIGIDEWSPNFSPDSLKGLSAPVWIRLPNLPLLC
ncbi:hypothetical protein M5K25_002411 [Dendrobium thyrsiflorum]|uniref:DUF4283 domain-containing protein n=1 Tax=Dendrobium thyrsiflorum TaxID=117978 RepID=A0ABD0VMD9_DENTH